MAIHERLVELDERASSIRERMRELRAELVGIESERETLLRADNGGYVSRTDEVFRFLQSMTGACAVAEIVDHLEGLGGADETSAKVSATLSHLRNQGKTEQVGRGLWRAIT